MSKKNTIILVEDEKTFVEAITKAAKNYDEFDIIEITDLVGSAFKSIKLTRPKIIITDIQLPDDSGLNLIRQVKNDDELSDYAPYIIGITSFSSPNTIGLLKDLVDFVHLKNSHFDADKIFIELRYALQSIESNKITDMQTLSPKRKKIEKAISEVLKRFNSNPKLERHYKCALSIISLALEFDEYNLKNLYNKVAPMVNLKNSSGVNSLMSRYLDEITKKTDANILEQTFKSCYDSQNPTAKEFIFTIAEEVKNKFDF